VLAKLAFTVYAMLAVRPVAYAVVLFVDALNVIEQFCP
jgi:hypothetical protein